MIRKKPFDLALLVFVVISLINFSSFLVLAGEQVNAEEQQKNTDTNVVKNRRFFGLGVYGGARTEEWSANCFWGNKDGYRWEYGSVQVIYGWRMNRFSDRWRVWFEGGLGYIAFNHGGDVFASEIQVMTSYDFLRFKKVNFFVVEFEEINIFAEGGAGIGYYSGTPDQKLIGHSPIGLLTYGLGANFSLGNGFYFETDIRFKHASSFPDYDKGLNTDGLGLKITKYF